MKKIWVHKARSFEEAERFERRYYRVMSAKERLETVDWLRQVARKRGNISGTRLQQVVTIRNMELSGRRQDQADLEKLRTRKAGAVRKKKLR